MTESRPVRSSPEKLIWPRANFTKGQMLDYYELVAPTLLPHLADKPLTLGRFPDGVEQRGFAQLECRGSPEWVHTASIRLRDGRVRNLCVAQDLPSLLWIANLGTIELHTFLGSGTNLDRPAAILFDLDPEPPAGLGEAARVALLLRDWLGERGLTAVVKTTGGSGLHVLVPLNSPHSYAQTGGFARRAAEQLASGFEWVVASATARVERAGTVLIDWAQNNERRTFVAPYSLRAADLPSVSTPVAWTEVEREGAWLGFGPDEALERIRRHGDLFAAALTLEQRVV